MLSVANQDRLQDLQTGDRLTYHGVQWDVRDYSTYSDPNGYETAEWLLRSSGGHEYYLLREVDPQNPETLVHWYLAEEISNAKIFLPHSPDRIVTTLWQDMQGQQTPPPTLQLFEKTYDFESQTQGSYEGDEDQTSRRTWDYWDREHQWNLAMEAWPNGEVHVYLSKVVKPEEFSEIKKAGQSSSSLPIWQVGWASIFVIVGILLMIFG